MREAHCEWVGEEQRDKRQRCVMKNSIGFAFFLFFAAADATVVSCCVTFAWDLCESFSDHKNKLRSGIFVSHVKSSSVFIAPL